MTYYEILLYLHIVGATIWLGSGFLLNALFFRAQRTDDVVLIGRLSANTEWMAKRIFIPISLLTLLLGILLTIEGPWQFDQLWIVLGLAGFAATFLLGIGLIEPEGKRLHAAMEQHGPGHPASAKHSARIDALSRLDLVLLFVVVFDMALKPTADDVTTLVVGGAALLAGSLYAVREYRRAAPGAVPAQAG